MIGTPRPRLRSPETWPPTPGVLPILHLNGYKFSSPAILVRTGHEELDHCLRGCGRVPLFVDGDERHAMHPLMAHALDRAIDLIHGIRHDARQGRVRPRVPQRAAWRSGARPPLPSLFDAEQTPGVALAHARGCDLNPKGKTMKAFMSRLPLALALLVPVAGWPQVAVSINLAPPPLPVYAQPLVPGDGYIWTPGYWSWNAADSDYYWVPGTWVMAPAVGDLWTPGYWGYDDSGYLWHAGYWGNSVGYYGGLNYGYGYTGSGYQGGRWSRGVFQYNRAASHVDSHVVHAIYNAPVIAHAAASHASYLGGAGMKAPAAAVRGGLPEVEHRNPTEDQLAHERAALTTPSQKASVARGAPTVAATRRPADFTGDGVEPARAALGARSRPTIAAGHETNASISRPAEAHAEARGALAERSMPIAAARAPVPEARSAPVVHAPPPVAAHAPEPQHAAREPAGEEAAHHER